MIMAYQDMIVANTNLPNRLKFWRVQRRWSQDELAAQAGISRTAISAIEGRRLVPSVATALSLAAVFGCKVEDLFGADESGSTSEPAWAVPPPQAPCRYWQANVRGRLLHYPAEFSEAGLVEHDGVFTGGGRSSPSKQNVADNTLVMACCDPAAGLLVRRLAETAGVRLLVLSRSSSESLALLGKDLVHVAGIHLATPQRPRANSQAVRTRLGSGYSLLRLACWQEGLALAPHLGVRTIQAAVRARLRWIGREPGSAARQCLDELLGNRVGVRRVARNHRAVAESIRGGLADAGVCLRLAGEEAGLRFLSVRKEFFDLCFRSDGATDPRIAALIQAVCSTEYRRLLSDLPGYDASAAGELEDVN
jgi:molybdate-binding protein/DNA-binding XRE family transcriptional regulator